MCILSCHTYSSTFFSRTPYCNFTTYGYYHLHFLLRRCVSACLLLVWVVKIRNLVLLPHLEHSPLWGCPHWVSNPGPKTWDPDTTTLGVSLLIRDSEHYTRRLEVIDPENCMIRLSVIKATLFVFMPRVHMGEVEVWLYLGPFLTWAVNGQPQPMPLHSRGRNLWCPLNTMLWGLQSWSRAFVPAAYYVIVVMLIYAL